MSNVNLIWRRAIKTQVQYNIIFGVNFIREIRLIFIGILCWHVCVCVCMRGILQVLLRSVVESDKLCAFYGTRRYNLNKIFYLNHAGHTKLECVKFLMPFAKYTVQVNTVFHVSSRLIPIFRQEIRTFCCKYRGVETAQHFFKFVY